MMLETTLPDQAQILRGMMQRHGLPPDPPAGPRARTVALTSGKGGVGKSVLSLNLAIALRKMGHSVCLLDACLGLGSLDLLCDRQSYWNLSHVVSGARTVADIVIDGPAGISLVPGASGLLDLADCSTTAQRAILDQLADLEQSHDYLVIDTGPGIHEQVRRFALAAELVCVVATPEPTAVADAYASVRALTANSSHLEPRLIVNEVDSPEQAHEILSRVQRTARSFLNVSVAGVGYVPYDQAVPRAVARRSPVLVDSPRTPASRAIEQIAHKLAETLSPRSESRPFFARFAPLLSRHVA